MDATHVHLIITHLPIYGSILGTLVLIIGKINRSKETRMAAYIVLLISSAGGFIAYSTGEPAEHTVEKISGINKELIEEHEEFAESALVALIALAITSAGGLILDRKNGRFAKIVSILTLVVALVTAGMVSWTGYLGGKIRHSEVSDMRWEGNRAQKNILR